MKLFIHMGFNRTGTHTIRFHLFEKHPQIIYLGRNPRIGSLGKPHLEITELISTLDNANFEKRFNELVEKAKEIKTKLLPNKTNLISDERIMSYSFHRPNEGDDNRTVSRFAHRTNLLFSKINVDVTFFYIIRNQTDIIKSLYSRIGPEVGGSLKFNAETMIQYLKDDQVNQPIIKRFLDGFKYWELYKKLSEIIGKDKVFFLMHEKLWYDNNKTKTDLSNYLEIDPNISIKLLRGRRENYFNTLFEEKLALNTLWSVIFNKIKKNLRRRDIFFENFGKKFFRMLKLIFAHGFKHNPQHKKNTKKIKADLNFQANMISDNSVLFKKYYENDCLKLKNEFKLDVDKFNYL